MTGSVTSSVVPIRTGFAVADFGGVDDSAALAVATARKKTDS
jgi:hypothetical protein